MEINTILHLTTVHPRYDPRILSKQCVSLSNNGYKVYLIVSDELPDENKSGVNILSAGNGNKRFFYFKVYFQIHKLISVIKPAIIHFHDPELIPFMIYIKLTFKKVNIIYDVHEDNITSINHKKYNYIKKLFFKWGVILWEAISNFFFSTVIAEKYYSERFPKATPILNYPIINDGLTIKRQYNIKRLLYTGNITISRGCLEHSNIVNLLANVSIHFVGRCSTIAYEAMKEKAGYNINRIHVNNLDSYIPYEVIDAKYNEEWLAGLAIFPYSDHYYRKELTKFFEYMLQGLPIICSNFDTWKTLIEENNCGICVNPKDEKEIIMAVKYLMDNPDKAKEFGMNGRNLVLNKFNWEQEAKKLMDLYDSFFRKRE